MPRGVKLQLVLNEPKCVPKTTTCIKFKKQLILFHYVLIFSENSYVLNDIGFVTKKLKKMNLMVLCLA